MSVIVNTRALAGCLLSFWGLTQPLLAQDVMPSGMQLEKVVVVSRHGVRPPTKINAQMLSVISQPWPTWSAKLGELTPRGAALVTNLGHYYAERFQQAGLLKVGQCPDKARLYSWADVDQRTRMTGQAWLDGLAPGCQLQIGHQADLQEEDPLFHPLDAKWCRADKHQVQAAITEAAGGDVEAYLARFQTGYRQLEQILNFNASPYCQQQAKDQRCEFASAFANELKVSKSGKADLKGSFGLAATLGEIMLLEYADGLPAEQVGWGRAADPISWKALMAMHNAHFSLLQQTPYVARVKGTPLMQRVLQALTEDPKQPGRLARANLVLLVGHDTNIANLAGILGVRWSLPDQPDNTPPGGALVFERWRDKTTHEAWIRVRFVYQTLEQLRAATPLSLAVPPGELAVAVPACEGKSRFGACPIKMFRQWIKPRLEPACLQ